MKNLAVFACLCALIMNIPHARADNDSIAVVELFSSPACQDTPPAEEIFQKLAAQNHKNLILLSCHVTFFKTMWDSPTARNFCDYRHKKYASALDGMFMDIPTAMVNGHFDTVGDNEKTVRDAINLAHSLNTVQPITIDVTETQINITLPDMRLDDEVEVWLMAYNKHIDLEILDGPFVDQTLPYVNLVTHAQNLLEWNGEYRTLNVERDAYPAEGYAVIAQYADKMEIIAAGKIETEDN